MLDLSSITYGEGLKYRKIMIRIIRIMKTKNGHYLHFDDADCTLYLNPAWIQIIPNSMPNCA